MSVRSHVLVTLIGVVVVGFGLMYLVMAPLMENALRAEYRARSQWLAAAIAADLATVPPDKEAFAEAVARWRATLPDACVAVVSPWGALELDGPRSIATCLSRDESTTFLSRGLESGWFEAETLGIRLAVRTALQRPDWDKAGGLLYVTMARGLRTRVETLHRMILMFMALAVLLVSLIGYAALTRFIIRPVQRISKAIDRVHAGDMDARAAPSGGEELQALAGSFNRLTGKLKADEERIQRQISELKLINEKLEAARDSLVRTEKLASVGKLAAGVAHEIGNPIGIVLGYLEMLQRDDCTPEEQVLFVEQSLIATTRIKTIIADLLEFSRPDPRQAEPRANVGRVVDSALQLLEPQKRMKHVTVTTHMPDLPIRAAIAESRLQQVLINLLMNAADATVGVAGARIDVDVEFGKDAEGTDRVMVVVKDNGPGVSEDLHQRIFDPFFTTKAPGSGTGLGLSICHGIITAIGGHLTLDTSADGARFVIDLPRLAATEELIYRPIDFS